ncbi:MAG: DUF2797 domain-containing protein [Halioglobus sp.]
MKTRLDNPVRYTMLLGDHEIALNDYLGKSLQLVYEGAINCIHCDRKTNKSFNQGYCYPCFQRLAQCDSCIVSPQKCHYAAGTCREPSWGEQHCMIPHIVYLANTSGLKVGITRETQVPTRWMDQGATQALPIFRVATRLHSGLLEMVLKAHVADKTNWQAMLKSSAQTCDLKQARQTLMAQCTSELDALVQQHGLQSFTALSEEEEIQIEYPVLQYPTKVSSFNLDKTPAIGGTLLGIKGQYLIFDTGVINMRKYGGYQLSLRVAD